MAFYTRTVRIPGPFVIVLGILASVPLTACTGATPSPPTSFSPSPGPPVASSATVTVSPSPVGSSPIGARPLRQPELCGRVGVAADGNVGPVVCPDGHPNAYAMPALTTAAPNMMALGEFATPADVSAAACADLAKRSTGPIEESAYKFMKALNGWSFGTDPTHRGDAKFCH